MPQISIVVPAYNAEKTIVECLDSLCRQTLADIEIICVNDGSTDGTEKLIRQYMAKDSRIQLVNKQNGGLALARKDGIAHATAAYIGFLDSDDTFEPTFCEKMVNIMELHDCDAAECGYYDCPPNGEKLPDFFFPEDRILDRAAFIDEVFAKTIVDGSAAVVVWNKVYRTGKIAELVKEYGHSPLEDYIFNTQYYVGVRRYAFIHECLVNYRLSSTSLSRQFNHDIFRILMDTEAVKQNAMEQIGRKEAWEQASASWYCRYVERYLLANAVIFRDRAFFDSVIQEEYFISQAQKLNSKDILTRAISLRNPAAAHCIFAPATAAMILKRFSASLLRR